MLTIADGTTIILETFPVSGFDILSKVWAIGEWIGIVGSAATRYGFLEVG